MTEHQMIHCRASGIATLLVLIGSIYPLALSGQIVGLDHVSIAVSDLDRAAELYESLGFALKAGRPHDNGIRNLHIKFPDGTELELVTADSVTDDLTAEYSQMINAGDGPAFLALFAGQMRSVSEALDAATITHSSDRRFATLPRSSPNRFLFFGSRNQSPTDRPEHFAHVNSATALYGVWVAPSDSAAFRDLVQALRMKIAGPKNVCPSSPNLDAPVQTIRLPEGFIYMLDRNRQHISGRPIVGVTVRVESIVTAHAWLDNSLENAPPIQSGAEGRCITLPPRVTSGVWIQLLEIDG